jgi:deoxyadenosine/deoxycytidine kinase
MEQSCAYSQPKTQYPIIISIQGNIGSGKSTLVRYLKSYLFNEEELREKSYANRICFLQEPVDIWESICDSQGKTMIEKFYGNQQKYAFAFQMMAYISRLSMLKQTIQSGKYDIILCERSLDTDRHIFAKMLYDEGKIEDVEYEIYLKWFDEFKCDLPKEYMIYIETDPSIAFERVHKRARQGESIPLEYLQMCHHYHQDWIKNKIKSDDYEIQLFQSRKAFSDILHLNGNVDMIVYNECDKQPSQIDQVMIEWMSEIFNWMDCIVYSIQSKDKPMENLLLV